MKKSVAKFFAGLKFTAGCAAFALISMGVVSCGEDTGLGSSVDTEAPSIEISYPPLGACVRDTFKLAGPCDDDKRVSHIVVSVIDTETKETVDTVAALVDESGNKWEAELNSFVTETGKFKYQDGNYQFTAVAYDAAGHSTSASRSFDIDNTAPVFVISSPGVIKSQGKKPSAYGSRFTIDGTIADDHTIASLTAKIVDADGTLLGEYKEEDVATAGGTSVVVAEHYFDRGDGTAQTEKNERYTALYGADEKAGTKNFYCTVLVEDSAKAYKNPEEAENTTSGNVTSKLYLNDSVYKELMSAKSGNKLGLTVADFMTILNGTRADDGKNDKALEILNSVVIDTGDEGGDDKDAKKLSFSLNPQANPTYNVNGFSPSRNEDGSLNYIEASSGNTVSVTISAGLDGTAILPGKVKIWTVLVDGLTEAQAYERIQKVADEAAKAQNRYESVEEIKENAEAIRQAVEGAFGEKVVTLVKDNSDDDGSSVTMSNISGMLPKDVYTSGKIYAFVVTGCDEDDVEFYQGNLYAFKASEAGIAPTLTIDSPDNNAYVKSTTAADLTITGTATMPEGATIKVDSVEIELTVSDENEGNEQVGSYTLKCALNESGEYSSYILTSQPDEEEVWAPDTNNSITFVPATGVWSFVPEKIPGFTNTADEGAGKSYFFVANVTATSTTKQFITKPHSIHVDTTVPKVEVTNVKPSLDSSQFFEDKDEETGENTKTYVNGHIEIIFNVEETNLKNVFYTVFVDGVNETKNASDEIVENISLGRKFSDKIVLDTTKLTDNKPFEVKIYAEDTCGNVGEFSTTQYNNVTYNDGTTDVLITPNKPIIIRQETDIPRVTLGKGSSYDSAYVVTNDENTNKTHKEAIKDSTDNLFNSNGTLEININDDDQVAGVKVSVYMEDGTPYTDENKTYTKDSAQWKYPLPKKEGIYQIEIEVNDSKVSKTPTGIVPLAISTYKTPRFFIAIDDGAPLVTITDPTANSYQEMEFTAKGTIAEKDEYTKIYRYIRKLDHTATIEAGGKETFEERAKDEEGNEILGESITINNDKSWTDTLNISEEDIYKIEYESVDRYGQKQASDVRIIIDKTKPVINDSESSVGGVKGKAAVISDTQWFNNETLSFKGEITEAVGIDMIYYWLDKDPVKIGGDGPDKDKYRLEDESESVKNGATKSFAAAQDKDDTSKWTYSENITGFTECDATNAHTLTLIAVDKAGNQSDPITYDEIIKDDDTKIGSKIKVDLTKPSFGNYYYQLKKNAAVAVEGSVSGRILTNGENDVTLYGTISDEASGVDMSKLVLKLKNGTVSKVIAGSETRKKDDGTSNTETGAAIQYTMSAIDTTNLASSYKAATWKDASYFTDKTKITAWKVEITAANFIEGEVSANYYDNAGNSNTNFKMFTISVDTVNPVLSNPALTDKTPRFTAYNYKTETEGTDTDAKKVPYYYVHNNDSHKFTLTGVATDNEGIASVKFIIGTEEKGSGDTGNFTFDNLSLKDLSGETNAIIRITDIANNVSDYKIVITPDNTVPNGIHDTASDYNHKDTIFRVGDADNILEEIKASTDRSTVTALTAADKDVGGKYLPGTYGNSNSIKIRGQFKEEGSGLKEIYYKIFKNTPPLADDITNFVNDYENLKDGVFAPLSSKLDDPANDKRLVKVNTAENAWRYDEIQSNYKMAIAGFGEGKNYLVVAAVDNVGNIALDNVTYTYMPENSSTAVSLKGCYSINVDTVVPELGDIVRATIGAEEKNVSQILTNFENGDITLTGTAWDLASGLDSVKISVKIGNNNHEVKAILTTNAEDSSKSDWKAEVDDAWFSTVNSGNFSVYATVSDNASNSKSLSVATITVDKIDPTVKLEAPADAADDITGRQINGIINLKGTIEDANVLPTTAIKAIQYTTSGTASADSDTGWTDFVFGDSDLSGSYTFNAIGFDTSNLTDGQKYYIRAKATDSAGNVGYSDKVEVEVDQNTDRPIFKITTLDENDAIISSQSIIGNISDDDGVKTLEYKDGDGAWTEIRVNSGSWRIDGVLGGSHSYTFRITDDANTVFETGKTTFGIAEKHFAEDGRPYVVYGKNSLNRTSDLNSAAISFKIDLESPVIRSIAIASTTDDALTPADADYVSDRTKSFGANAKYMWIKAVAQEDVLLHEICSDDVLLKIGKKLIPVSDIVSRTKIDSTGIGYGFDESESSTLGFKYIIGPIDTSDPLVIDAEGTLTVSLVVSDKSGRASDAATANIYIDKTAPEVSVTSPNVSADGVSSDSIIGTTVLRGQISDSSTIAKFYYMIPTQAQIGTGGIFASLTAKGTGYTYSDTHGWKDFKTLETSKAGVVNDYTDHTSMLWEIPVTTSKFVTESTDGLSLIEYATAKTGSSLTYAEVSTVESSVNEATTPAADKKYCVYVPLYFYTEDETGISKVTATKILVDPHAGIPRLEISAPEDFAKTGGNLNFQGSVTDDAGDADKVVLTKLEFSTVDAVEADFVGATAKADSTFNWKEVSREILAESGVVTKGTLSTTDATITAEGKPSSWKISINTSAISTDKDGNLATLLGTQGSGEDEEANDIKIARATFVAYDKNGTASTFQVSTLASDGSPLVKNIFVDKNAPKLSNIQLVQYDEDDIDSSTIPTISRSYSAGMYISHNNGNGVWYLKATITDDASVEGFSITSGKNYITLAGKAEKGGTLPTGWIVEGLGDKECTFIIPIETENPKNGKGLSATQFYPTIELDDGQHTDVTQNLSFFVDNDAPAMYLSTDATETPMEKIPVLNKNNLRLTDNNGLVVGSDNVVENSDGQYSFGDMIKESGSGLAYVAVWFRKEKSNVGYWYNAIETKTAGGGTSINHGGNGVEIDGTTVKTNDEDLPVKVLTGCERPALNQIKHSDLAGYTDFGVGSLVKIGGSYHLITDKGPTGTSGIITIDDDVDLSITTVEMVYANVVNHQVAEGFESDWTVSNDDGDGFVEMVKQSGNNYKWQATLRSDFIPDGPVQIYVVAFDEAGNVNSGYVETSIQNNRPRISKVFLGTDLNGNGTFDYFSETATGAVAANNELYPGYAGNGTEYGELSFYSALSSDGKIQGNVTLKSSNFVAKDKLLVLPEIIGGNTTATKDLKYLYKVVDDVKDATITRTSTGAVALANLYMSADDLYLADKTGTAQTVEDLLGANHKADKWNYYDTTTTDYKGEDNTHGGVVTGKYKGLVLDNATLTPYESWKNTAGVETKTVKYFAFTIWDATDGTVQGKTSLYALLKIPMVVNVVDDIAPKAVIHPFYWNSKEDGSFCYDEDGVALGHIDIDDGTGTTNPGVSGQVWINATVEDETRLSSATFTDPGDTKKVVANYSNGNWEVVETGLPAHWKKVEILDSPEPNQAGHKMSFRVAIDMTSYGLGNNRTVNAGAVDKSNTESDTEDEQTIDPKAIAGTTHTGKLTSHYIMNFVPYIKSIYPATESSASRSRLGKFPVQAGKPMIIEGMNFAAGAEYCVSFYKSKLDVNGSMVQDDSESATTDVYTGITSDTDGQIKINAPNYSRWVKVWINTDDGWIGTMNNENVDYGCNIEEGYVPSDDNGKGNRDRGLKRANDAGTNFWTDDRYIAVWNNTALDGSTAPWDGKVVQIDSKDLKDSTYYKNKSGNGIDPLSGTADTWSATWSSPDLIMYTSMGNGSCSHYRTMWTKSQKAFDYPIRTMDWTIIGGKNWYVVRDDFVTSDSANVWGPGLFLGNEGFDFPRTSWNGSQAEDRTAYNIIEKQGDNKSADSRDPSTGYDSVLEQFQNPHITGWYDGTTVSYDNGTGAAVSAPGSTYIYVSYYDSFAKCLKYAAYKEYWKQGAVASNTKWGSDNGAKELVKLARAADDMKKETVVVAGVDRLFSAASSDFTKENGADCGLYNDIMIDPSDHYPVIIYYNKTAGTLEVAHGKQTAPVTANYKAAAGAFTDTTEGGTGWSKTKGITPNAKHDFGRFVSATMDAKGNIHATAQDFTNGSLYYIFLKKSETTYTPTYIHIDAVSSNSTWTDIRLDNDVAASTNWYDFKPVISYIDESKKLPKVAYVDSYKPTATTTAYFFEAVPDAKEYEAASMKTTVLSSVYETTTSGTRSKVGISFNSDMLALDFLRGEE